MFARRVDITAGTPGHRYLVERQWKCLENTKSQNRIEKPFVSILSVASEQLPQFILISKKS